MLGTLRELADRVGGSIVGDGDVAITSIAAVGEAYAGALTFATDERYLAAALESKASAVLVDASIPVSAGDKPFIVVENARYALAQLLRGLRRQRPQGPFVHPGAVVDASAHLEADVYVGAGAYIGPAARVGARTIVDAGAYVGESAIVGEDAWLHPHASLMSHCHAGDRVVLHVGAVIGSEGFGWAFIEGRLERIPQIGNVVLEDDVEIGANTCVDRAQTGSTRVGCGTKIDNLVQIGHNCEIGRHCAIAALTGLAGSTAIGDYVKVAGQVGTRGHMRIGSGVTVAGKSGVWGDVADGAGLISGNPARDHREDMRREVMIRRLPQLIARIDAIEKRLGAAAEPPS